MMIKKLHQTSIYKDAWLELFQDEIAFPDGSTSTYAWVNRKNGVAVVVVANNTSILLHKEYRYVISDYSWEIQGGGIDEGESDRAVAVRELQEESGLQVSEDSLTELGVFYPLNSFNTESVTLFMVKIDQTEVSTDNTESSESIGEQRFVSFAEALNMIDSGQINDAFTANAVQIAMRKAV